VRTSQILEQLIDLSREEKKAIDKARAEKLPFGITPYYISLMDKKPGRQHDHAVRAQVIPPMNYVDAMLVNRQDRSCQFDFMLEHDTSPIDLITRRYPRIVILKPYNTCSQICVYCQRNWEIDDVLAEKAFASRKKIVQAINWIKEHPAIDEVLITGGDPLVMNDDRIDFVLSNVAEIDQVERIRIGSRTPVVLPQRITDKLINIIAKYHEPGKREIVLVTHFEHPYEVTLDSMEAIQKFKRQGISVYNQAVFTVENSRRYELVALRKTLRLIGVDPYYTFNTKGKKETKNYRVPLARLMQEIKEEARLIPGTVRTDEPVYNVPRLGKNYIRAQQHHSLIMILPNGKRVYEFHPWEKKLALADTYVDTDVSIWEYLQELKQRGEDIEDYRTIWYYY
jgi:lysine 2,3-aminomutase